MKRVLVAGKIIKSAGRRHESQVTVPGASVYSQPRWGYSGVDEFHPFRAQANGACWCGRSEEVILHKPEGSHPDDCILCSMGEAMIHNYEAPTVPPCNNPGPDCQEHNGTCD